MARNAAIAILAAAALLFGATGCGTRSILVPVTRPARINLQTANGILLPPTEAADSTPFSLAIAARLDSLLPSILADGASRLHSVGGGESVPSLFSGGSVISRQSLRWWRAQHDAELLLTCLIVRSRLAEQVAHAALYPSQDPGEKSREKVVRQGRAEAMCRVFLIDLRREALLLDDTLSISAASETHAANKEPVDIPRDLFVDDLARRIALTIADAARPIRDRDVVTFLVEDDFPELETAIAYAEEGRWNLATALLRRLAAEAEDHDDADVIWYDLGLALQYEQDFNGALQAFDRAIAIRDRGRYRHARAALLQAEEEYLDDLRRR